MHYKKGNPHMMFLNLADLLSKNLSEYTLHPTQKTYFEEAVEFFSQQKVISKFAGKNIHTLVISDIHESQKIFLPSKVRRIGEKKYRASYNTGKTIERVYALIAEFRRTHKLGKEKRDELIPILKDLAEICLF